MCKCFSRCLKPCFKFKDYIVDEHVKQLELKVKGISTDDDPTSVLIFEQSLTRISTFISHGSSWATSGILALGCEAIITGYDNFYGSWVYFGVILLFTLCYITFPQRRLDTYDYQRVGINFENEYKAKLVKKRQKMINENKQLQISSSTTTSTTATTTATSDELQKEMNEIIGINDNDDLKEYDSDIDNQRSPRETCTITDYIRLSKNVPALMNRKNTDGRDGNNGNKAWKPYFIDEANILSRNMNILISATFANLTALAFMSAIEISVQKYAGWNYLIAGYWVAASIFTLFAVSVISYYAQDLVLREKATMKSVIVNGIEESKDKIMQLQER